MKAHELARVLLAGPDAEVAWEDATPDPRAPQAPAFAYQFLTRVEHVRTTSDGKLVVLITRGDPINNPDWRSK